MIWKLTGYSHIYEERMNPALNRSSAIRHFKHSDVIEIRDGIIFDFYMGLPHLNFYTGLPHLSITIVQIVQSYTRKYHEFVAICIVTSAQHE